MNASVVHMKQVRKDAAIAFLGAFLDGRPMDELRTDLPEELEATGQGEAAVIVRSFFHLPRSGVSAAAE